MMPAPSTRFLRIANGSRKPAAVVLGTNLIGLAVARSLRLDGVRVLGVDRTPQFPTSRSSAWDEIALVGEYHEADLIPWLCRVATGFREPPVLIASSDEQVKLVANAGRALEDHFRVARASRAATMLLMNKQAFAERAEIGGWPIPRTWSVTNAGELEAVLHEVTYPVILKPHMKNRAFHRLASAKAFRCDSEAALRAAYAGFASAEPEAIVQEWVEGPDHAIRFSFHYLTTTGEELGRFEGRKIRQWHPGVGSSASATRVAQPTVGEASLQVLRECGAAGFCSMEYKYDAVRKRYLIMEPTIGRPNLQVGAATAHGVDLVRIAYAHLTDRPVPATRPTRRTATWVLLRSDWRAARHYVAAGELTWAGWIRSLSWPLVPAIWRWTDRGLWGAQIGRVFRSVRRRLARARRARAANPSPTP